EHAAKRLKDDPSDPIGLYRRAQLRISRGQTFDAVDDLRQALTREQPPRQSLAARNLLFKIAGREALSEPAKAGRMLDDLGKFATNKEQKAIALRLLAENRLSTGDYAGALEA